MSSYRYCSECRGDDGPFLICTKCSKKYHPECVGISSKQLPIQSYICTFCVQYNDVQHVQPIELTKKLDAIKLMHHYQLANRNEFIQVNKASFLQFCDNKKLEHILNIKIPKVPLNINDVDYCNINDTPSYLTNASLRDYQVDGINKINSWYLRGIGGILADEMGLGKTIQTIMFLASTKHILGVSGPHLVVTPLAVLQNWSNGNIIIIINISIFIIIIIIEFFKFAPSLTIKKLHGNNTERRSLFNNDDVINGKFDVYLTTYDVLISEEAFFSDSFIWASITIDEGTKPYTTTSTTTTSTTTTTTTTTTTLHLRVFIF